MAERDETGSQDIEQLELLDNLIRGFIHDLNNHLTTILGFSEIIASETADQATREYANLILDAANRAHLLVNDLNAVLDDENDGEVSINLSTFLKGIIAKSSRDVPDNIHLSKRIQKNDAPVLLHPLQTHKLVNGILQSYIDLLAASDGGDVVISLDEYAEGISNHAITFELNHAAGITIDEESRHTLTANLERIRVQYLPSAWTLHTLVDLQDRLRTEITIDSGIPSQGIPRENSWFELAPTPKAIDIIDDDELVLKTLRNILKKLGHEPRQYQSSTQFLQAMDKSTKPPDLIITDLHMVDVDGIALIKHVRRLHKTLPIILYSAYINQQQSIEAMREGANIVLRKPVNPLELAQQIEKLTGDIEKTEEESAG